MSIRALRRMAASLLILAAAGSAHAAGDMIPFGKEHFQLNFGWFHPNFDTRAKAGIPGSALPPNEIDLENDLDLDTSLNTWRVDGYWRFADRHRLYFGYYRLNRDTTSTLNRDIGPISIPDLGVNDAILAGSNVEAESRWDAYLVGYGYSFYKTDKVEVAAKFGLTVARIDLNIHGTLVTQNHGTLVNSNAGGAVTAPLPAIGLNLNWALSERWKLRANLGGLSAKFDGVDASVVDASAGAEYRLLRNFGVGAGYSLLRVSGDIDKGDYFGSASWRIGGWQMYGLLVF